jgi:hypothetical protein
VSEWDGQESIVLTSESFDPPVTADIPAEMPKIAYLKEPILTSSKRHTGSDRFSIRAGRRDLCTRIEKDGQYKLRWRKIIDLSGCSSLVSKSAGPY